MKTVLAHLLSTWPRLAAGSVLLLGAAPLLPASPGAPPWNVLFIVSDDLRPELGCYGVSAVQTPRLDRLAAESLVFDRAYVQYPVCNASRSSFLTGWRPDRLGYYDNGTRLRAVHPHVVALPQLFRQNGYTTAGLGKIFHAGTNAHGQAVPYEDPPSLDYFADFSKKTTARGQQGEGRNLTAGELKWCQWRATEGGDLDQPDGLTVQDAIRWLDQAGPQPFFLAVGLHRPHDPFFAPRSYFDLYPPEKVAIHRPPADRTEDHPLALPRDQAVFARFTDRERVEFKRAYYACISFMDAQVGRLLDALAARGLADRTIVVFLGDHGYHLGEHGWWNKVTVFELCARVPLLVRVPGRPANGARTSALVELVDLYPTLAGLCGLPPPAAGLDGRSFAHLLDDPSQPAKPAAFTQVTRGSIMGRSVRTGRWRYTEWDFGRQGTELYAHPSDPHEYHNLAADPALASTRAELKALLDAQFPSS